MLKAVLPLAVRSSGRPRE